MLTVRIPEELEKKIKIKAKINNRTVSEQLRTYLQNAIEMEENPDLPLSFIKDTLEAKKEIENGLYEEYKFGTLD
jgi:plasmid stability protein